MKDLTQGSVTKHLLQMTAFLAISMAVQTLYLLADLYWVGHLGQEAIAALGVAGKLQRKFLFPKSFQEGIAEPGGTVAS